MPSRANGTWVVLACGVLPEMSFPGLLVHSRGRSSGAQRVEDGPVVEVLDGVVGSVVASPAFDAFEEAALVEIAMKELLASGRLSPDQRASSKAQVGGSTGVSTRRTDGAIRLGTTRPVLHRCKKWP